MLQKLRIEKYFDDMSARVIPNERFFIVVENIIGSGKSLEIKVKGSSMYPALVSGKHKVVLSPFQKKYLRLGMIALFVYGKKHVLHRLVAINGGMLTFQGDNLPYSREIVGEEDIIAFVEFIIAPKGKVVDCKTLRFAMKSRLQVFVNKHCSRFLHKTKGLYIKACLAISTLAGRLHLRTDKKQ